MKQPPESLPRTLWDPACLPDSGLCCLLPMARSTNQYIDTLEPRESQGEYFPKGLLATPQFFSHMDFRGFSAGLEEGSSPVVARAGECRAKEAPDGKELSLYPLPSIRNSQRRSVSSPPLPMEGPPPRGSERGISSPGPGKTGGGQGRGSP